MFLHAFLFLLLSLVSAAQDTNLLQKGLLELKRGELAQARSDLEAASRAEKTNAFVWSALAEVYARSNALPLAQAAATQAEDLRRGNVMVAHALALYYAHVQNFLKAGELEREYAGSGRADKDAKARAAGWLLAAKDLTQGLPLAKEAASSDTAAAFALAQELLKQQEFSAAADTVGAGLATHPKEPQLVLALGAARYGQRRFNEAIDCFLQVVSIDPEIDQPYLFLARMLDQAGSRLPEIARDTDVWAHKNADNPLAQVAYAKTLLAVQANDERALAPLKRAIELAPGNWEAHYELGVLLAGRHDYAGARGELGAAAKLDPTQPMPHYHLARVYDRLGDSAAAKTERAVHSQLVTANSH